MRAVMMMQGVMPKLLKARVLLHDGHRLRYSLESAWEPYTEDEPVKAEEADAKRIKKYKWC